MTGGGGCAFESMPADLPEICALALLLQGWAAARWVQLMAHHLQVHMQDTWQMWQPKRTVATEYLAPEMQPCCAAMADSGLESGPGVCDLISWLMIAAALPLATGSMQVGVSGSSAVFGWTPTTAGAGAPAVTGYFVGAFNKDPTKVCPNRIV